MKNDKYIVDLRIGCVAVYLESREGDTNGCHSDDQRNVFYRKGEKDNNGNWFVPDSYLKEAEDFCTKLNNNGV